MHWEGGGGGGGGGGREGEIVEGWEGRGGSQLNWRIH